MVIPVGTGLFCYADRARVGGRSTLRGNKSNFNGSATVGRKGQQSYRTPLLHDDTLLKNLPDEVRSGRHAERGIASVRGAPKNVSSSLFSCCFQPRQGFRVVRYSIGTQWQAVATAGDGKTRGRNSATAPAARSWPIAPRPARSSTGGADTRTPARPRARGRTR